MGYLCSFSHVHSLGKIINGKVVSNTHAGFESVVDVISVVLWAMETLYLQVSAALLVLLFSS